MTRSGPQNRWRRRLRYAIGTALFLLTLLAARTGLPWYWALTMVCVACMLILGRRRIFRPGVTRTTNEIVCRYIPWFEGNAYFLIVGLPLMAIASIAAGYAPGNPTWLRYGGIILLCLMPLIVFSALSMWRRCILRISPSELTVRLAAPGDVGTEIPRERIQSITAKEVPNSVSGVPSLQVEIAYQPTDASDAAPKTVLLGLQLTVQPYNLLNALLAWNERTGDDPEELLDRIERLLLGRSATHVVPE